MDDGPTRRARSNSLPTPSRDDAGFARVLRSVLTHGLLPQPEMQRRGIAFNPSHDQATRTQNRIEVTRVRQDPNAQRQREYAVQAVTNPSHGALTVALEHGANELSTAAQTAQRVFQSLDPEQRAQVAAVPALLPALVGATPHRLTTVGREQAEQRMQSSFMVLAPAGQPPHPDRGAHEAFREGGMAPADMRNLLVPEAHARAARQVYRDLSARDLGRTLPQMEIVPDTRDLTPDYRTRHGRAVEIADVPAPAYHVPVAREAFRGGHQDIHLVRTEQAAAPAAPRRPRSRTV